jgi:MFS family permease
MAVGRLVGGRLVSALGERRLLAGGAVLAAAGVLAAVTTSSVLVALAGFVLVGLGLANVFPLAIARAGALGGPSGVALSTTVGYTGLLGGPPVIGFLAEHAGLPVALGTVAVLSLVAAVLVLGLDGDRVRRPSLPGIPPGVRLPGLLPGVVPEWVAPAVGGLRPVASKVGRGTRSYVRDLEMLSVS